MSRCFPFPPPGYENKETSDKDLLEKEKHKEKKDKKEKRGKEKREGKGKNDRNKDKHKVKKDKKEKHKEKKKDKDRDKAKAVGDSTSTQNDSHHESSLLESSQKAEETNHSKFTAELARRIKVEEKVNANRMVQNCNGSNQRSTNGLDSATLCVMERVAPSSSAAQRNTNGSDSATLRNTNGSDSATLRVMARVAGSQSISPPTGAAQKSTNGSDSATLRVTGRVSGSHRISPPTGAAQRSTNGSDSATLRVKERVADSHSISLSTGAAQRSISGSDSATLRVTERVAGSHIISPSANTAQRIERVAGIHSISPSSSAAQRSTNGSDSATLRAMERVASSQSISLSTGASQRTPDVGNNLTRSNRKVEGLGSIRVLQKERSSSESEKNLKIAGRRGVCGSPLPMGKPVGSIQGQFGGSYSIPAVEVGKFNGNQVVSNPSITAPKGINGMCRPVEGISTMGNKAFKDGNSPTNAEDREINKMCTNHILLGQRNAEGMVRSAEDAPNKSVEGKEKKKDKKSKKDKHRDKDKDEKRKKRKGKDKLKGKEKEKEKTKIIDEGESKHKMNNEPRDGRKDHAGSLKVKPLTLQSVGTCYSIDENIKKRKEVEMNDPLHENNMPPNKIARTTPSHNILVKNGSMLELPRISSASSSLKSDAKNNFFPGQKPADVNKCIANGVTEAGLSNPVTIDFGVAREVSLKPPHPDAKHLGDIYAVPRLDEWPEYDDQQWLFSLSKIKQRPKSQVGTDKNPQVWAEAVSFESGDVLALPYVVPF